MVEPSNRENGPREEERACLYLEKWFRVFYRDLTAAQGAALELDALAVVDPASLLCSPDLESIRPMIVQVEEKRKIGSEGVLDAYRSLGMYPGGRPFILLGDGVTMQDAKNSLGGLGRLQLPPIVVGPRLIQVLRVQRLDEKYGEVANLLKILLLTSACGLSLDVVEKMLAWANLKTMPRLRFLLSLLRPTTLEEFRRELPQILDEMKSEIQELDVGSTETRSEWGGNSPPTLFALVGIARSPRLMKRFWAPAAAEFVLRRRYKRVFVIHSGDERSEETAKRLGELVEDRLKRSGAEAQLLVYGPSRESRESILRSYLSAISQVVRDFGEITLYPIDLAFIGELEKTVVLKIVESLSSRGHLQLEGGGGSLGVSNLFCGIHGITCIEAGGGEEFLEHGFIFERVWPLGQA